MISDSKFSEYSVREKSRYHSESFGVMYPYVYKDSYLFKEDAFGEVNKLFVYFYPIRFPFSFLILYFVT